MSCDDNYGKLVNIGFQLKLEAWQLTEPCHMVHWNSVKKNLRQYLNDLPLLKDRFFIRIWTGLTDKNKSDWYTMDIIQSGETTLIIDYSQKYSVFNAYYINPNGSYDDAYEDNLPELLRLGFVKIGNKFENPELLKQVGNYGW